MDSLAIAIPSLIAIVAVFIGAYLQRRGTLLTDRRLLVGKLDGLSVMIMEYGHAIDLFRHPSHRSLYTNPPEEAIDYRIKAYETMNDVREITSSLNGNCNALARKEGQALFIKVQALEDSLLEICKSMFDVNLLARHFPNGLPYVDPFYSVIVIKEIDKVSVCVNQAKAARKEMLEVAGNTYREPSFTLDQK
ncbi:hypothetical protein [Glutamicibacter protophormiae]|uniref:hypothetical protein n=1 Tax=Glutamicibacter protophormiae TaxID=37930 RepID=UPI003A91A18D